MPNQKFPQIGLVAILEITGFSSNARKYTSTMRDIDRATQQTAQKITRAGQQMASGFASSLDQLSQQSKKLNALNEAIQRLERSAAASPQGFQQYQSQLQSLIEESAQASQAFQDLGNKASVNIAVFDQLYDSGVGIGDAMRAASAGAQFSIETFDRLIRKGFDADKAFEIASRGASGLGQSVTILGRQFSVGAVAIGAATTAIGASIKFTQKAISEYTELAEATRRLRYETGLLSQEASSWVQVAQASGVSASTASRGMAMFLSRVSDLRREQQLGEESTSDFSKALDFLQVSITDGSGTLKSTEQLLGDVNAAFQDLGPGIQTAGAAADIFGRSGRQLLPILTDQENSLADYMSTLDRFGSSLNALSQKEYEEFLLAQFQLRAAIQSVFNYIATNWIPMLTQIQRVAAEAIGIYRTLIEVVFGAVSPHKALQLRLSQLADVLEVVHRVINRVASAYSFLQATLNPAAAAARALADAEEEAAQKRFAAKQALAEQIELEAELRKERLKTLEQLDELKTKLTQKLSDIDEDAEGKWDDILVKRMRDAADRSLQNVFKLEDLRQALNDKLDAIDDDFAKRWDDILVKRQRDALVRGIRLANRYEDLARNAEKRRQDVLRDFSEREAEQRRDVQSKIEKVEEEGREKREKLEREHQRRLADIRLDFLDTATEAARKNDAVAVARAQRERDRELRDEQRRYADEQVDLAASLAKKRADIEKDRQEREQAQRDELARALQRVDENYRLQRESLERQNAREREMRQLQQAWELEDFNKAKAEQEAAAQEWYDKQIEDLEEAQRREAILRAIEYERQEIDFVKAWQRRIAEAQDWYAKERDELAVHLNLTGEQLERAYTDWMREAAEAAAQVATEIADTWVSEITRYQHLLSDAQRQAVPQRLLSGPTAARPSVQPLVGQRQPDGTWTVPGGPAFSMAEGGVVQASSPTTVVMGDAGPETGVFLPGGSQSMNVNHNFGRMGVDFQGLPGGMNTQQAQALMYAVITKLAKGIRVPRA